MSFNVRRHFGVERAYPFDWWITPLKAIAELIEQGFPLDIESNNLLVPEDRSTVINQRWGILHHHDFPRDRENKISPNWHDSIPTCRQKYSELSKRFYEDLSTATEATFFLNSNRGDMVEYKKHCHRIERVISEVSPTLVFRVVGFGFPGSMVVHDYGDRYKNDPQHFGGSVRGWDEAIEQANGDVSLRA